MVTWGSPSLRSPHIAIQTEGYSKMFVTLGYWWYIPSGVIKRGWLRNSYSKLRVIAWKIIELNWVQPTRGISLIRSFECFDDVWTSLKLMIYPKVIAFFRHTLTSHCHAFSPGQGGNGKSTCLWGNWIVYWWLSHQMICLKIKH